MQRVLLSDMFSRAGHMTGTYDKHASGGSMQALLAIARDFCIRDHALSSLVTPVKVPGLVIAPSSGMVRADKGKADASVGSTRCAVITVDMRLALGL